MIYSLKYMLALLPVKALREKQKIYWRNLLLSSTAILSSLFTYFIYIKNILEDWFQPIIHPNVSVIHQSLNL